MKILMVNKFFFLKGGAETVFFQEREMAAEAGFQVIDFSMQHERNLESPFNDFFVRNIDYYDHHGLISKVKTAIRFIHNQEACQKLAALIRQERPDIVHFHNIYHQLTPSVIKVAKANGCKTVLTVHDTKIACPAYTMYRDGHTCEECLQKSVWHATKNRCQNGSLFKSLLLSLEARFQEISGNYRALDMMIAPSEFLAGIIRWKLPDNRIEVIVNGIDESIGVSQSQNGGYFLYLGRLSREKGVETLAKAYQLSRRQLPLKIVGDGPLTAGLSRQYSDIELLGFKKGDELESLIRNATAVIVPSECYENCSMSVLEAMAYGKPVIGARIGGIPEQVRDGVEGRLFPAGDGVALAQLMDEFATAPELVDEYGRNARLRLEEKYSLTRHKQALLDLYQSLTGELKC
ncbi:Alpha-D-kanosaminyltransferase [Vibrio aerogenes CECT 7868]|uniref:Alpha-D-kanosaminyltransferase n=1 Tax=Vibrio aerogenes CECT 7868 TaxID=1216006 RepID=A0A1M5VSI1_9VIBR|nr:glycosyltransferase family 4 protein [Vibrio aerogenes]SHH78231.1 Alpha-D-kanosaminyltransferase [Vibrio aerogenes CECT 7868]